MSSRQPAKRKRKTSASSSKTRETSLRNGSAMTTGTNCSSNLSGNGNHNPHATSEAAVEAAIAAVNSGKSFERIVVLFQPY